MEKEIYEMLDSLKNGKQIDFNIFVGTEEYKDYVKLGRNSKERLQILIMCYVNNPKIEELNNWSLDDLLKYIKETDDEEFYEQDMVEIRKCIDLINEEIKGKSEIMSDKWKETSMTYKFLKDFLEDMTSGNDEKEYDIEKTIDKIMEDDELWDNLYYAVEQDLVEKESK